MKKIFILLLLSFLIVGCGSNKQASSQAITGEDTQIKDNEKKDDSKEKKANENSMDVYLDESQLAYKDIIFNQDYVYECIGNKFEIAETDSIDGVEIYGVYNDKLSDISTLKKGYTVNLYFPSEINGKPVLSIRNTEVDVEDEVITNFYLPESALLLDGVSPWLYIGMIYVNDNMRYVKGSGYIDRIVDSMRYFSGIAFLKQDTFDINDNLILDGCDITGDIGTINVYSFSKEKNSYFRVGQNYMNFDSFDDIPSNIKNVNIYCDLLTDHEFRILSENLYIGDNVSISGEIAYFMGYGSQEQYDNGGTLELGKNVRSIDSGYVYIADHHVKTYIINDPSNVDVISGGHIDPDYILINKSGQEVDWGKMFVGVTAESGSVVASGRLEFYDIYDKLYYVDVIAE